MFMWLQNPYIHIWSLMSYYWELKAFRKEVPALAYLLVLWHTWNWIIYKEQKLLLVVLKPSMSYIISSASSIYWGPLSVHYMMEGSTYTVCYISHSKRWTNSSSYGRGVTKGKPTSTSLFICGINPFTRVLSQIPKHSELSPYPLVLLKWGLSFNLSFVGDKNIQVFIEQKLHNNENRALCNAYSYNNA